MFNMTLYFAQNVTFKWTEQENECKSCRSRSTSPKVHYSEGSLLRRFTSPKVQ